MFDIIKDWAPIIISGLSLIFIFNNIEKNSKNEKKLEVYRQKQNDFEDYKEKVRQQEKQYDLIIQKIEQRSTLVPYFQLYLNDADITFDSDKIILKIQIINIGKESATNVQLCPIEGKSGLENYFKTENSNKNIHYIYDYLNQYYAFVGDKINFSIINNVDKNKQRVIHFIQFKIRYNDLIGNLYEQKFRFGYDNYVLKGYNRNNSSYQPKLIKESQEISDFNK